VLNRLCENEVFIAFFCCGIYSTVKNETKYWALALNAIKLRAEAQIHYTYKFYGINAVAKLYLCFHIVCLTNGSSLPALFVCKRDLDPKLLYLLFYSGTCDDKVLVFKIQMSSLSGLLISPSKFISSGK